MVMTVEERKANKKLANAKYRANNRDKVLAGQARFRLENPIKVKESKLKWRANSENAEKELLNNRVYRELNGEKVKKARNAWRANDMAKAASLTAEYRATKFGATVYMTKEDKAKIAELYTIAKDATKLFGYTWAVDHIVPLNKGGLHKLSNLQVVPGTWNSAKGDRNCDTYWD